jgi:hypothetical protein
MVTLFSTSTPVAPSSEDGAAATTEEDLKKNLPRYYDQSNPLTYLSQPPSRLPPPSDLLFNI